jgi:hypothetical protein
MKKTNLAIAFGALLTVCAASTNATFIIFDNNNGGTAKTGVAEDATGATAGNPNFYGPMLGFTEFSVSGGYSNNPVKAQTPDGSRRMYLVQSLCGPAC